MSVAGRLLCKEGLAVHADVGGDRGQQRRRICGVVQPRVRVGEPVNCVQVERRGGGRCGTSTVALSLASLRKKAPPRES